jgi:hypothetical protein
MSELAVYSIEFRKKFNKVDHIFKCQKRQEMCQRLQVPDYPTNACVGNRPNKDLSSYKTPEMGTLAQ